MSHLVVPLAIAILVGIFLLQPVGSGRIGVAYGPVMLCWFAVLGVSGLASLRTLHTSRRHPGQIYQPAANWTLAVAVLAVVVAIRSAERLANAYGVTVSTTVVLTVALYLIWAGRQSPRPTVRLALGSITGLAAAVLFAATLPKLVVGGWVPAAIGAVVFALMHTWWTGEGRVATRLRGEELTASELARMLAPDDLHRVDGHAVFLTHDATVAPLALCAIVDTTMLLPEHVLLLSWVVDDAPRASADETAVRVRDLGGDDWDVVGLTVLLGYRERLDVGHILRDAIEQEPERLGAAD